MELLTVGEAARMLKLSRSKIYDLKEKIGYLKIGGSVRFEAEALEEFVRSCRVNGSAKPQRAERRRPRKSTLKHIII